MLKLKVFFSFAFVLISFHIFAQDVYISDGNIDTLQAAIDDANTPDSQVTIHLRAGQSFEGTPWFSNFRGNLKIKGNGAVFGYLSKIRSDPLGRISTDGTVTITGATFVNIQTGPVGCSFIQNQGRLSLERVTFSSIGIETTGNILNCNNEEILLNDGWLDLVNVTVTGTRFWAVEGSIIRATENASTSISHLTVVDTTFELKGDSQIAILRSESEGSISVGNSIILADENSGANLHACVGPITDKGGNFSSSGDCGFSGGLINRNDLDQLIGKGHDAWVLPLLAGSIAVDSGNPDECQKLDGRGFERGALCDSGSYESGAANHGGELTRGGVSGFYFTPESDGNYIQVQRAYNGNVVVIWNTFDADGAQAWINAVGSYKDGVVTAKAYRILGGVLQPGGGASGGTETDWGAFRVTAHNCNEITVEYESTDPGFGDGTFEAKRLAYVHDLGCSDR
jgi:hypothetical protein